MRVSRAKHALLEREAIGPKSELCRDTYRQGRVALGCELQSLPVKVAQVQRTFHRSPGIQVEPQISPMHGDWGFRVVVENPTVRQHKPPDA